VLVLAALLVERQHDSRQVLEATLVIRYAHAINNSVALR